MQRKRAALDHFFLEGACIHVAHDEVCHAVAFPVIEDRQDVRMLQLGNDARLLLEARRKFLALRKLAWQDLDRYITVDRGLVGFVYSCHSASANLIDNAIGTEHLPGLNVIHASLLFDVPILRRIELNFKLHYPFNWICWLSMKTGGGPCCARA